jgi:pSer/pThr/pTyr-binding forkhead associated (FHA) protein
MDVKLLVVGGKHAGTEIAVTGSKLFIGRAEDCHIRPQSDLVSRHHCAILVEEGFISVRDFGSRNGTFVNNERITGERELKAGDRVKVGPLELEVQLAVSVGGKKKSKIHSIHEAAARTVENRQGETKEDLDISDWLQNEDTPPAPVTADTQQINATKTTSISIGTPQPTLAAVTENVPEPAKDKPAPSKGKAPAPKTTGKFDRNKQPATQSSGDAADAVLRQFFGRKR